MFALCPPHLLLISEMLVTCSSIPPPLSGVFLTTLPVGSPEVTSAPELCEPLAHLELLCSEQMGGDLGRRTRTQTMDLV